MSLDANRRRRRRRVRQIALITVVLALLLAAWLIRGEFSLGSMLGLESPGDTLTLYALSTLNFIALVTLAFVLVRHLLKLARERRQGRLGSHFKTRMVMGSIALTLLPAAMLFLFSFWLIDTTIRIFLQPTEGIVSSAQTILNDIVEFEARDLHAAARRIARSNDLRRARTIDRDLVERELQREARNLRLATIILSEGGAEVARADGADGNLEPLFRPELLEAKASVTAGEHYQSKIKNSDGVSAIFVVVGVPIGLKGPTPRGMVLVRRFPPELASQFSNIDKQQRSSQHLIQEQRQIRVRYIATLTLVTLILLFAAVWIALYVSREVTEPIQALVEATGEVAGGNLQYRIECNAGGELATLVESFNAMAAQLGESRTRLVEAARELEKGNKTLEERRAYIETVLAGISTGVVSIGEDGRVTTVNAAAVRMLRLGDGPYTTEELLAAIGPARERVETLLRRARRSGSSSAELELHLADGEQVPVSVNVSMLAAPDGGYAGAVVTIEDLSELIKAERAAAWSEVARRMAHEIKNPLTPIQLSAERILRNFQRKEAVDEERFATVIQDCTATIIREVGSLQHMVGEFSRFARMPQPRFERTDLNEVVRTAIGLYEDRLDGVKIDVDLVDEGMVLDLDPEQIRRVIVNLMDNSLEAVKGCETKQIRVSTRLDADVVRLVVEDTGHGIDPSVRENLFLPYFSTRTRGTGLGLAIVSHIVADHRGRVRAEPNCPSGARFIVEFPVAAEPASAPAGVDREREPALKPT